MDLFSKFLLLEFSIEYYEDFDLFIEHLNKQNVHYDMDEGFDYQLIEVFDNNYFITFDYYKKKIRQLSIERTINFEKFKNEKDN